ncbi:ATP-binding protein [Streptomyces sp. BE133]|uniref:ATP-binding protein n=1 Tax=Streptomyces sp. BE133 TaxID=3002523 RepID=UPI003FA6B3B6
MTLTGELVSNAIRHALPDTGTSEDIAWLGLIRNPTHLVCAVTDPSNTRPTPQPTGQLLNENGRGLHIIEALAESWGYTPHPTGKTVWAVLPIRSHR